MKKIVAAIVLIGIYSCASLTGVSYEVSVDTYGSFDGSTKKVFIFSSGDDTNPLFDAEVHQKIENILRHSGYIVTRDTFDADIVIHYRYGLDAREVDRILPLPQPTTSSSVIRAGSKTGTVNTYSNSTSYVATTTQVYDRALIVEALSVESLVNNKPEVLWHADVFSTGHSSDLRTVLNYLLVSAFDYYSKSSGKRIQKNIVIGSMEDKRIAGLISN